MTCVLRRLPVTDFTSDHTFANMSKDTSHHARVEAIPIRPTPSREDFELAHQLVGHSQGLRNGQQMQNEIGGSPSPSYERENSEANKTPPSEHMRQPSPRASSLERSQGDNLDAFAPVIPQTDNIPSGQVCR